MNVKESLILGLRTPNFQTLSESLNIDLQPNAVMARFGTTGQKIFCNKEKI